MDTEFELEWQNSKDKLKNWLGCFEIDSMFRISVHGFFPRLVTRFNMVRVIEGRIV